MLILREKMPPPLLFDDPQLISIMQIIQLTVDSGNWNEGHVVIGYSLSRREESWENKLSACLLACVSAGSKKHRLVTIFIRVDRRVIGVEESESGVSF